MGSRWLIVAAGLLLLLSLSSATRNVNALSLVDINTMILNAPANTVYFIYPDNDNSHPKCNPQSVGYAALSDWTAAGFIFGMLSNVPQNSVPDTRGTIVSPGSCAPVPSGKALVLFGGPLVNSLVYYYELNRVSPVYWQLTGSWTTGTESWYTRDGAPIPGATMSVQTLLGGHGDMFLVEVFQDANGNTVLAAYGFGGRGTFASGYYFKSVISPNLASYGHAWYIFQWTDGANGQPYDGFVQLNEITPVAQGD